MTHKQKKVAIYSMLLGVIIALIACIIRFFIQRALWLDEAMLALSILTRNATSLISEPLDWGQSAPIGYLYSVKLCTFFFGFGENALRLFSFISWLGVCVVLWKTMRVILKCTHIEPLFVILIFMTNGFFMRYACECKPYMNDNFWILLVLFSFRYYWIKSIKPIQFAGICSLAFIFSFASVFAIASCYFIILLREALYLYKNKNISKHLLKEIIATIPLTIIGIIITVYWVLPATNNAGGKAYWELWKFPLFPTSAYEWDSWIIMIKRIAAPIGLPFMLVALLSLYGIYTSIRNKTPNSFFIQAITLTILFTLIASNCGYYPIEDRLIQYISLLMILIATYAYKELTNNCTCIKKLTAKHYLYLLIGIIIISFVTVYKRYFTSVNNAITRISWDSDKEPLMAYKTLLSNDKNVNGIYIGSCAMPVYQWLQIHYYNETKAQATRPWELNFKKGSRLRIMNHSIHRPYYLGEEKPQIIQEALDWIKKQQRVYIFISHEKPDIIPYLANRGLLENLYTLHGIEIYRFTWQEDINPKPTQN